MNTCNLASIFQGLTDVLVTGVDAERIITTMVLVAADRMARTPVNVNPGWGALTAELNLAASLRTAKRYAGPLVTRKALYHVGYRHFDDRWLNITTRPLPTALWPSGDTSYVRPTLAPPGGVVPPPFE